MDTSNYCLRFKNLRSDIPVNELKRRLENFHKTLGILLHERPIFVHPRAIPKFAFVNYKRQNDLDYVIDVISNTKIDTSAVSEGNVSVSVKDGIKKVSPARVDGRKSSSTTQVNNNNHERPLPLHLTPKNAFSDTVLVYHGANANGHVDPNQVSIFMYYKGSKLGCETRNVEFKCGQGRYVEKMLAYHVSKYLCAYLNSDGGVLIIGVSDDGTVIGIHGINRKVEDSLRLRIDSAIKDINPTIFPSMYRISFLDVLSPTTGRPIDDLKVIEVEVEKGTSALLYETHKGEVYIRLDGSVQGPLKAHAIQEWMRLKMEKEIEQANREIESLKAQRIKSECANDFETKLLRLQESKQKLDQRYAHVQESKNRLEREKAELGKQNQQLESELANYRQMQNITSKVCVIS